MRRCVLIVALLTSACAGDAPVTSPTPPPTRGAPVKIELSATPGTGEHGGTASVRARVLDGLFAVVPDATVTFTADAGTLAAAAAQTDTNGIASTSLIASPGTVKIGAVAGSVHAPELEVAIQPVNVFVPPPPSPPPPPPPPPPPIPPPTPQPLYAVTLAASPSSVVTGTPTTLTATVTPLNGAPAVTAWAWDCDTSTFSTDATTPNTATCTYATVATFTAGVRVTGGTAFGSATTTVTATAPPPPPPVIPIFVAVAAVPPGPVATGSSVVFTATLSSAGPPPTHLQFDWDDQNDGVVDATTTLNARTVTVVAAGAVSAIWKTSVKVTDLDTGRTATGLGQLTVNP